MYLKYGHVNLSSNIMADIALNYKQQVTKNIPKHMSGCPPSVTKKNAMNTLPISQSLGNYSHNNKQLQ